jgi:hypothetical protein
MPQKGTIEKTEEEAGNFLWMPDVVAPIYDILKSLSQTAKIIGGIVVGGFLLFIYVTMVLDLRKTPYPWTISLVAPLVIIFVGASILLIIVIAIGFAFAPITLFGVPIVRNYPFTCPPTHPELNGLLCYKPCPSGRHRVGDVCWADTVDIGIGTPVGLEKCPVGWRNDGLTCWEPIGCYSSKTASKVGDVDAGVDV